MKGLSLPLPSIVVAACAAIVMYLGGSGFWMALAILLVWLATLWLARPEPMVETLNRVDGSVSRQAMIELVEPFGLPVLMLDGQRIAAANAAAREELGTHIIGQDARVALRHPEAIRLLQKPEGRALVRGLTGARSIWQVSRVPIDERFSLIEMVNRTAEADISRAHTDFVANASHELRTPLASIIGYIETLADPDAKVDEVTAAKFHATVLRESRRLQSLVEDLMSLSRIEAEKHELPRDRIDLGQMVGSIASETEITAGEGRLEANAGEAIVLGDRQQLDQLVRNLIDNAFKYGDPTQPVRVGLIARNGEAELVVTDKGEGIHPDHLPYLTRRFYRTDPGRSRAAGGTGLGLAIVKHIVERHRGKLDIASTLGVGTTVTVRIPLAPQTNVAED
ncbi:sensor histidine kinase [Novosphingobium taihuense]|uniref:histidine kinase n=1 Tax=Novosphingobium taihuense TaxID=260085 RepID=A0A7W7ET47_9SPHN|nr:ATP-binding protein [Novosphingobium taihuense]MBB4612604.1 two-component system phosphate regulon sensor histidine kinase PhoR [Novosphingobium taihuense]TWH88044.1 two-component system phosphate regulon sensor histidine kinase PhoR [Novosphingobium taihuense]